MVSVSIRYHNPQVVGSRPTPVIIQTSQARASGGLVSYDRVARAERAKMPCRASRELLFQQFVKSPDFLNLKLPRASREAHGRGLTDLLVDQRASQRGRRGHLVGI